MFAVAEELRALDPEGHRFAWTIREAFDQIYDGRRTGRWDYSQLMKTEKTHLGTVIEIWLQRELGLADGRHLDFLIAGVEVDCKWSRNLYEWEIPIEMYLDRNGVSRPGIALLLWGNEHTSRWAAGLIRVHEDLLREGEGNRDRKRRLNARGCDSILWLFRDKPMVRNTLLHHPDTALQVMSLNSGQQAVNSLFRRVQGELVNQATVETVAQQTDGQKRVRDARIALAPEGIVIFGHYKPQPEMAADLGLPAPFLGSFVSATLAPWTDGDEQPWTEIAGRRWRLREDGDPVVTAPRLPSQGVQR